MSRPTQGKGVERSGSRYIHGNDQRFLYEAKDREPEKKEKNKAGSQKKGNNRIRGGMRPGKNKKPKVTKAKGHTNHPPPSLNKGGESKKREFRLRDTK